MPCAVMRWLVFLLHSILALLVVCFTSIRYTCVQVPNRGLSASSKAEPAGTLAAALRWGLPACLLHVLSWCVPGGYPCVNLH